jgi:hypothetical protein
MFHAPRNIDGSINHEVHDVMRDDYPPAIANWFNTTLNGRDYWFSGYDMNRKFNTKVCEL